MNKIFDVTEEKMQQTMSTFTLTEIYQQPATWKKTCDQIKAHKDELKAFIDQVITREDFDVILTGAGTSEFGRQRAVPRAHRQAELQCQVLRHHGYRGNA